MNVSRLYLRNYRVYEDPVELEIPPGLVGIYGPNGAGKSLLVESIRFALYGRARTGLDEVRTAEVNGECVVEVEFEHEGHLYRVRRTLSGINATQKASAYADNQQMAEGARDVSRYVHSVLGMDDPAFRASVFAEQKQLAAFSQQAPADRKKLVLQLLGITPVDAARDMARKDARQILEQFENLRSLLPDLDGVRAEAEEAAQSALNAQGAAVDAAATADAARAQLAIAQQECAELEARSHEHQLVQAELQRAGTDLEQARARGERLQAEVAALEQVATRLEAASQEAKGLADVKARLRGAEAVLAAQRALAAIDVPPEPPTVDEAVLDAAVHAAQQARERLAEANALLTAAQSEHRRAADAVAKAADLTVATDCPLCGQALGEAFHQVRDHRRRDLAAAEARVGEIEERCRHLAAQATAAAATAEGQRRHVRTSVEARAIYERAAQRRSDALAAADEARRLLGRPLDDGEPERLAAVAEGKRRAAEEAQRLAGRLERRAAAVAQLEAERLSLADAQGRIDTLTEKAKAIDFLPERLAEARTRRHEAQQAADEAGRQAQQAAVASAQASSAAQAAAQRRADVEGQHRRLSTLGEQSRHLGRVAELLSGFRNELVATAEPRLTTQAAELFAELTDHEYDRLEVNPDTYEIRVRDGGQVYGMQRFSGSETDLANLALRVAISEQVRFQSGGAVGLLVLDEVFGPLDEDRKQRMLLALERLRARFRQVLVVTHDVSIKEQLPNAIEVVKLPGRRATARVLSL